MTRQCLLRSACAVAGAVMLAAGLTLVAADGRGRVMGMGDVIGGPYARLLAEATDLGPARGDRVALTAALRSPSQPVHLDRWARTQGLAVDWQDGDDWAVIEGPPAAVAEAFGVTVHDYRTVRGPDAGRVFYASPQQPDIPPAARTDVSGIGRILDYLPYRWTLPPTPPRDVPEGGMLPNQLHRAYNVTPLTDEGYTGKGTTVVVFSFDGFLQQDMDSFADRFDLPPLIPEVSGGMPDHRNGEATMDLQVIHAVAPDAKLVMVNARPSVESGGGFVKVAELMDSVDERYPGAIWSFSIGWGCDRLFTKADLQPVRTALRAAMRHGTSAFIATGDLAGLECKGGHNWAQPPVPDDIGVDAVASIPEITSVGGTRLSTDAEGNWLAEQSWYNVPLTQGSAGGASQLYCRPPWQAVDPGAGPPDKRLVPDISARRRPLHSSEVRIRPASPCRRRNVPGCAHLGRPGGRNQRKVGRRRRRAAR